MEEYDVYFEAFGCHVSFGWGKLATLGTHAGNFRAGKALVVTDEGVFSTGIPEKASIGLRNAGIDSTIFKDISPNPTDIDVGKGIEVYNKEECDMIISVGGGSPMDAAKGIRVLASHEAPLKQYFGMQGAGKIINPMPPLIAIPTTAGTGSEVSPGGMITDTECNVKKPLRAGPASIALVDPELTLGMPPQLTAATGIDALSHCIEAFLSHRYHPVAEAIGYDGIRLVAESLVAAVKEGKNQKARVNMAMAATMGALAFQKGTGVAHATAHQLSTEYNIHHGVAIAVMLPHAMEFNREVAEEKLTRIAFAMGEKLPSPDAAIQAVTRLSQEVSLPQRLSQINVPETRIPNMACQAMDDKTRLSSPRQCTEEDMKMLYQKAM